jgi:hypothetical protein
VKTVRGEIAQQLATWRPRHNQRVYRNRFGSVGRAEITANALTAELGTGELTFADASGMSNLFEVAEENGVAVLCSSEDRERSSVPGQSNVSDGFL